jgi:hypothetical protein
MKHIVERFEKEVAYLIEKLKEELGLADDTTVHTDSGGNGPPPPPVVGGHG